MLTIKIYESESEYAVEDDVVFSMQIQNGEFVQSMMSVDADVDVISEALEMAADEFSAVVADESVEVAELH